MLLAIIIFVLFLIFLPVVGLFMYLYFSTRNIKVKSKRALKKIDEKSPYRKSRPPRLPHNQLYARAKDKKREEIEKSDALGYSVGLKKYNEQDQELEVEAIGDQIEIVGLAEPKGFWSKFIMNQKSKFILARLNMQQSQDKGFWVNLIKAQSMSQGKSQGRGK